MKIENMINDVVKKYGFEAPASINFCKKAETEGIIYLTWLYMVLMNQ